MGEGKRHKAHVQGPDAEEAHGACAKVEGEECACAARGLKALARSSDGEETRMRDGGCACAVREAQRTLAEVR